MSPDNQRRLKTLLDAAKRLGGNAPNNLVKTVLTVASDFRVDLGVRKKAMLCYPAIALPSEITVKNMTNFYKNPPVEMDLELAQLPSILAQKCRKSIDYVVASVNGLTELRRVLFDYHAKLTNRKATEENEYCITQLRSGINEIAQIIITFKDFIQNGTAHKDIG